MSWWDDVGDAISDGADYVADAVSDGADAVGDALSDCADTVGDVLEDAGESLEDIADDIIDNLNDGIDSLSDAANDSIQGIGDIFEQFFDIIESASDSVVYFIDGIIEAISDAIEELWASLCDYADNIVDFISEIVEETLSFISDFIENVTEMLSTAVEQTLNFLAKTIEQIVSIGLVEAIIGFIGKIVIYIVDLIRDVLEAIIKALACQFGIIVYLNAQAIHQVINVGKSVHMLPDSFRQKLSSFLTGDSFSDVYYIEGSNLVGNAFNMDIAAMTFGHFYLSGIKVNRTVLMGSVFDENDFGSRETMIHELVHAKQINRYGGEIGFGCMYGIGFMEGGCSYKGNPLEEEAYNFTDDHYDEINSM
jgi:methyl-accepting chemotaxis protein